MDENQEKSVFHSLVNSQNLLTPKIVLLFVGIVILGLLAGYFLVSMQAKKGSILSAQGGSAQSIQKGAVYGSDDTKTFSDSTQGTLVAGGINGEGQFHLVRPGGDSQNVYMTSSLVDLSLFINRSVKVWGQTQKAKTAGWLMDVGRVEVLQ